MQRTRAWICDRCLKAARPSLAPIGPSRQTVRSISQSLPQRGSADANAGEDFSRKDEDVKKEEGAMSRRLSDMTEEMLQSGGRRGRKAVQDAGFSDELKRQLEEKIAQDTFRAKNHQAFSVAEAPSYAGEGSRAQAAAESWKGTESFQDSALRMLDDSHRRLRVPGRTPRLPTAVDLKPAPKAKPASAGQRLANARDKTSIYAMTQESMSEKEKERYRKELKDRFTPAGRSARMTITGLQSLANERIEDAIARGQFKNIPRGKGANIERDYNASSPFLDTTEYFMNKIIQKQEIVPPWIEKQQELVKAVHNFRTRLRNEWRRHAARVIASRGGSIADQVQRAKAYALAETRLNPPPVKREALSDIDSEGNLIGSVVIEQRTNEPVREAVRSTGTLDSEPTEATLSVKEEPASAVSEVDNNLSAEQLPFTPDSSTTSTDEPSIRPAPAPFRDPDWEALESAYHSLAIQNLNSLTRSYNLMAPKVAQKPYYHLERELRRCYAEVAPQLPREIEERARAPKLKVEIRGHRQGGVMERFGASEKVRVYDERREKAYGFKQFWKDLWSSDQIKA